jgi:hypothetical protein
LANSVGGPEKAGGGGSIPSLATTFSNTYSHPKPQLCSILFQKQNRLAEVCLKFWNTRDRSAMTSAGGKRLWYAVCKLRSILNNQPEFFPPRKVSELALRLRILNAL